MEDSKLRMIKSKVQEVLNTKFSIRKDGAHGHKGRLYALDIPKLKREILEEVHSLIYAMHHGSAKMY